MGTRKADEQQIRNLTANGTGTYSVSLPIGLVQTLRWQRGQRLTITKQGKKLIVEDWQS